MDYASQQIIEMLRRSYHAVDGLWFVMCEKRLGFAAALELDDEVWRVMPKIQARKAREVLGLAGYSLGELARAIGLKLTAEGHEFEISQTPERVEVRISRCPWHEALVKAERVEIGGEIARVICENEGQGWAAEFGQACEFDFAGSKCCGGECCRFVYRGQGAPPPTTATTDGGAT